MAEPAGCQPAAPITLKLHGVFASLAGRGTITLEAAAFGGPTLADALEQFHCAVGRASVACVLLRNGVKVDPRLHAATRLEAGDVISVVPVLLGG